MTEPVEQKLPNVEGWWARCRSGSTKWFYVCGFDDNASLSIWIWDTQSFVDVSEFTIATDRWWGPITLPFPGSD